MWRERNRDRETEKWRDSTRQRDTEKESRGKHIMNNEVIYKNLHL